jgi:hypothetical protein
MDNQSTTQPTNQLAIPPEIHNFLDGLLQDGGIDSTDAEMKEEMIKELYVRLDSFITSVIIDNLPAENLEEFTKMNEEKKPRIEIKQFLKDKMPNSDEVFAKAFMEFRNLYLGNVAVGKNDIPDNNISN